MNRTMNLLAAVSALTMARVSAAEPGKDWRVVGCDRSDFVILKGDAPAFSLDTVIAGEGWIRTKPEGRPRAEGGQRIWEQKGLGFYKGFYDRNPTGGRHDVRIASRQTGPRTIETRIASVPEVETQYSMPNYGVALGMLIRSGGPYFRGGKIQILKADGTASDYAMPPPPQSSFQQISGAAITASGDRYRLTFDPPLFIHADNGEIRMFASPEGKTPAKATMTQLITLELPADFAFEPGNRWVDASKWIVYENANDFVPGSVMGMEDWLEKPAGKRGWLQMDGDNFKFADGTPVKFWGINISYSDMAKADKPAGQWNSKWAKHGVNLVRLHKFIDHGWAGIMSEEDHLIPDPTKVALFDLYHATARERGIYLGWSASYGMKLTPSDKERVWFFDEVAAADPKGLRTYACMLKSFAPDLQDLLIAQTINLLTRTNSVTGIRYADDPALAYVELHNEEDIFFPGDFGGMEKTYPKYYDAFRQRFNDWLKKKYGSQEELKKAWGAVFPTGQTLGAIRANYSRNIRDKANAHEADTLGFMYDEQLGFYRRFTEAIRKTGYGGAICGSCWQASNWMGHLFNTLTDYETGFIDRHNYAGTPLNNPGVGNMSVGMQMVKGRPFNFSEWGGGDIGVPTVAIYGMGLQGWDASCQFSSSHPFIHDKQARACQNCCDDFIQIGQYPALARMIYRGDVKEGDIVASRRIGIPELKNGSVGVYEHFTLLGGANNKEFSAVVPSAALMAGRVVLEFVDGPTPEPAVVEQVAKHNDAAAKIVRSNTGQLMWDYSGRGYYTVNTPGTQAVFGHVNGKKIDLADVVIATDSPAPVKLYVTSLEKDKGIKDAGRLLITALARDANTGMVFDEFSDGRPLEAGGAPLLIEPVVANIAIKGRVKAVMPLDHGGSRRDGAAGLAVKTTGVGSEFVIDGRVSKTMYYLVEMQ